jgi:NAD(P)-dependent dehydrogenase (short-subunit alcohol dehydrogenase family)
MNLLITGIGSGLGKALALEGLRKGFSLFALSRRLPRELEGKVKFERCDLRDTERIGLHLSSLLRGVQELELVFLNAGILGEFGDMREVPLRVFEEVMRVNVWANKVILDTLMGMGIRVHQVVAISSGAARNCNRGWNAYSISKASLNCLIKLYAREMPSTHLISVAPGLIITPMLEEVLKQDPERFPSVKRIAESPKKTPEEAARELFSLLGRFRNFESGEFVDVRTLKDG